ncbi:RES family NAD+ phosphorylase [Arcobacter peruensis]|uniref:RES family NAD+ phosphorylase n=1 Tax=Arcobacter peruensis TaxID=2320140 RepID=UPI000F09709C|nr:RES family NAD+ phosphorylase [Arcobacter peruensis]
MIRYKKYFCINCFEDENIKNFIKNKGKRIKKEHFKCKFCNLVDWKHNEKYDIKDYDDKEFISDKIYIINQNVFNKKIIKIINKHFEYVESPKYDEEKQLLNLVDILSDKLFWDESTDILIKLAKYEFIKLKRFPFNQSVQLEYPDKSKHNYDGQEIHLIKCWKKKENISWKEFKEHTKHKARYFDHKKSHFKLSQQIEPFKKLFKSLEKNLKNQKVYRARIINSQKERDDIKKSPNTELGKAPVKIVKNNRFSPIGISYGYFSFDEKTAINEIRAELNKEVAIGTFKLNEKLSLVDFTKLYCLSSEIYGKKDMNPFDKGFNILLTDIYEFIKDISRPINESDTLLEYVPTQIMAEYIWSLGYDGFIFDSSQNKDGENIVLFGNNPSLKKYEILKIKDKNIAYRTSLIQKEIL